MLKLETSFTRRREKAKERMDICKECEHYIAATVQCGECWCFLAAKTMMPHVDCPIGKWHSYKEQK